MERFYFFTNFSSFSSESTYGFTLPRKFHQKENVSFLYLFANRNKFFRKLLLFSILFSTTFFSSGKLFDSDRNNKTDMLSFNFALN